MGVVLLKNATLVQIFLNQFYRKKIEKLASFVSPSFSYSSPAVGQADFQAFVDHCKVLFGSVTVYVDEVKNYNDRYFLVDYSINIMDDNLKNGSTSIPGCARFLLVNNLIENIIVKYDPSLIENSTLKIAAPSQKQGFYL